MGGLSALVALTKKDEYLAIKSIIEGGLNSQQFNIIKQLANAYDRNLAK